MSVEESYEVAEAITKHHAKSFYFSSIGLPRSKKRHAYAVYAFCRYLDDVVDEASPEEMQGAIDGLREFVGQAFSETPGTALEEKWLPAFRTTVETCEIPESYFMDLLTGVEMDQGVVRLQTWEELDRYCYHVAGVVGLMMTRVFDLKDRKHETQALELGTAMQLTNILRDVKEDLDNNRIYLPAEELAQYGLGEEDLRKGAATEDWVKFMKFQVGRARDYYLRSEEGIVALPNDGTQFTAWMMRDIYAGILDEIEGGDYDVFWGRHRVTLWRKVVLALKARFKVR